jgi:cell division protein FtsL
MTVFDKQLETARLHVESEIVKREGTGSVFPPGDRLDVVTDMIILLADKYRRMTRLLMVAIGILIVGAVGMAFMLYMNRSLHQQMERVQMDQETMLMQQRETRKDVSEAKSKLDRTTQEVTETKEAVEKAVAPPPDPKKKR